MVAPVRLIQGLGKRGEKKPGCPATLVTKQLCALRALRKMSPSGVNGQIFRSVIISQNALQLAQTVLGWIAGDDRRIDRADGDAGHPVGLDAGLVHRLINAGLIGAERAAALQHKRDAVAAFRVASLAGAGGKRRMVDRAGTDVMHGKSLKNANGQPRFSFAKASDRQMTQAPDAKMKEIVTTVSASFHILRFGWR